MEIPGESALTQQPAAGNHEVTLGAPSAPEITFSFVRLGAVSFGGPAGALTATVCVFLSLAIVLVLVESWSIQYGVLAAAAPGARSIPVDVAQVVLGGAILSTAFLSCAGPISRQQCSNEDLNI